MPPAYLMKVAPLWENAKSDQGPAWSQFAGQMILTEAPDLMKGTADIQMADFILRSRAISPIGATGASAT
jgi:hypothetical protein